MATTLADDLRPLHHPHSWVTRYVWSQDHKVIAIQYSVTAISIGLVALVLSALMRLQLGFPGPSRRSSRTITCSSCRCTA